MAVPTHFRFVVRGSFIGAEETWSTSCHFSRDNPAEPDAGLDDINEGNVTSAVAAYFGTSEHLASTQVDDWRFYVIGTDGHMEGNGPLLHEFEDNEVKGTGTSYKYPNQVALVATLVATNRGPARFGRMYLPPPNKGLDTTGRLSAADAGFLADSVGAFLKAVADSIDMELTTSSEGLNISPGPPGSSVGTRQTIDHIEVGRVLDTMRSRRRSLIEERAVAGHLDW